MDSTNPATNTLLESYEEHSQSEVDGMLGDAVSAFGEWKQRPLVDRERLLAAAADVLRENAQEYAGMSATIELY